MRNQEPAPQDKPVPFEELTPKPNPRQYHVDESDEAIPLKVGPMITSTAPTGFQGSGYAFKGYTFAVCKGALAPNMKCEDIIDKIIVAAGDTIIATYTKERNTLPAELGVCYEKKKSAAAAKTAAIETAAANRINTSASDFAAASV
ncbi:hypothetical protein GQ43DRAFT_471968 [Delitschia confertaspora ATCC 74209]|uniref:Uncharacterized protein n=1 Tax=Delitschia confertaspora ATCC 74209 TaxID=1513339 RepID=A0A9P4MYU1_9PLEO|nr:hypothetical protein GQ43DRAFT_471968 [Delitschia confertaspora ATCC 74209]